MAQFWSIQTWEAWESTQATGELCGNLTWVPEDYRKPYAWMMCQMEKRLPLHYGGCPIWVWVQKPDLRQARHLKPGRIGVRLQLDLNPHMVLLSDFSAWHAVLNNDYLSLNDLDDQMFMAGAQSVSKEQSWERIFNFSLLRASEWWGGHSIIQGVVEKVSITQVIGVTKFTAR